MTASDSRSSPHIRVRLPERRDLYYGGAWHVAKGGYGETINPATGESLGRCASANAADVDAAVQSAHTAYRHWRWTPPLERAERLRKLASVLRQNDEELSTLDAANCGSPVKRMRSDVHNAAAYLDYCAGLVTEIRGDTIPGRDGMVNMTVREPFGVCARIVAYNHPLMFTAAKAAAPLAVGNTVVMKPPEQAPLSAYRMMELFEGILPSGVFNIVTGGRECGEALVAHHLTPVVTLVGSVPTGRAIAKGASDRLKHTLLELGGKNALVVYPDADIARAVDGAVRGMNLVWCGQSCGSTSRLFLHEAIHDRVLDGVVEGVRAYRPGIPTDPATNMGALVSKAQLDKVMRYIALGVEDGARLVTGGKAPDEPKLAGGFFVEPTIFAEVTMKMRIAREEIFGPVLSVIKWRDEDDMLEQVNGVEYGLTASIYTTNLANAHRAARRIEAGYIWVNDASTHYHGMPFGGFKQSGLGREESIEEILSFTQVKSINIAL